MRLSAIYLLGLALATGAAAWDPDSGPAHSYAAPLHVECLNHTSCVPSLHSPFFSPHPAIAQKLTKVSPPSELDAHHQWLPLPPCAETSRPLEFHYGVEGPQNCTLPLDAPLHALLSHHLTTSTPLACRLPARPRPHRDILNDAPSPQEYIPLALALSGSVSGEEKEKVLRVAPRVNVLLHTAPKRRIRAHDTGVLDSGVAYSTSPLASDEAVEVSLGGTLELRFSVRWFPNPELPSTDGSVRWAGMGGHVYLSTIVYVVLSFAAGAVAAGAWFYGRVLPGRMRGRGLGGATPLGGGGVGNGWGYAKRID